MDDPHRLVDDPDASPLARSLLASADHDAPSSRNRADVAKRLGIAAGLLAGGGEVGAGAVAGAIWWKIGLLVVVLGGAITGGVALLREPAATAPPVIAPAPAPAPPSPPSAIATAEPEAEPMPAAATPAAATPPAPVAQPAAAPRPPPRSAPSPPPADPAPPPPADPAPASPAAPPSGASPSRPVPPPVETALAPAPAPAPAAPSVDARRLAAEVAILDRARAALRRGDTGAATTALDEHAREFADGALLAEAELVRIETLIRAGRTEAARRRAGDFHIRFPQSPLAKRLRSLVDRLPPAAKESP